jgi:two-component system NarL family sensor kinase
MLLLASGIVFFVILYQRRVIAYQIELKKIAEQKELELLQASIQSEEEERMRIASELHDDVNATLATARLFLYKAKDSKFDENIINQSKDLLDESIQKIRSISHKLQPATLQHLGLELALQSLTDTLNKSGKLTAAYTSTATLPRIADNAELALYRIVQELLANIIKHSAATIIAIETSVADNQIHLAISHDGAGLTQESYEALIYKKGATGLKNIVNRLKATTGAIRFHKEGELYYTLLTIPYS